MKENTTTTALVVINQRTARITRAHSRHTVDLGPADAWAFLLDGIRPPVHLQRGPQIIATANTAAYTAIRARHEKAGYMPVLEELQNGAQNDMKWADMVDRMNEAGEHRAEHDSLRAQAAKLDQIAGRVSTAPADALRAAQASAEARAQAAHHLAHAEDIERDTLDRVASIRMDVVQAAAVAIAEIVARGTYSPNDFPAVVAAAGKAINTSAAPDTLTGNSTHREVITEERAVEMLSRADSNGKIPAYNARAKGYYTVEQDGKTGIWRSVYHNKTAARVISYEVWASGEAAEALSDNGGINAILGQDDAEALAALYEKAGLSERERMICGYVTSRKAGIYAAEKVAEHMEQTEARARAKEAEAEQATDSQTAKAARHEAARIRRRALNQCENVRAAAMVEWAVNRAGIASDSTRKRLMKSIREKLHAATEGRKEYQSRAREAAEAETVAANRADIITAMSRAAADIAPAAPVVQFVTLTDAERKAREGKPQWRENNPNAAPAVSGIKGEGQTVEANTEHEKARARAGEVFNRLQREAVEGAERRAKQTAMFDHWEKVWAAQRAEQEARAAQEAEERKARLAELNTPEKCAARLAAMRTK